MQEEPIKSSGEQSERESQSELRRIDGTLLKNPLFGLYFSGFNPKKRTAIIHDLAESVKAYGADRKREVRVCYEVADGKIDGTNSPSLHGAKISCEDGAIRGFIDHFPLANYYGLGPLRAQIRVRLFTRVPEDEHSGLARVVSEQGFSLE